VVMAVGVVQDLGDIPQEHCRLPEWHAALHEPCRSRLARGVGCQLPRQAGKPHGRVEALFYRGTARAIKETLLQQNPDLCGVIDAWDGQSVGTFPTVSHP